jgi:hypothetical protein
MDRNFRTHAVRRCLDYVAAQRAYSMDEQQAQEWAKLIAENPCVAPATETDIKTAMYRLVDLPRTVRLTPAIVGSAIGDACRERFNKEKSSQANPAPINAPSDDSQEFRMAMLLNARLEGRAKAPVTQTEREWMASWWLHHWDSAPMAFESVLGTMWRNRERIHAIYGVSLAWIFQRWNNTPRRRWAIPGHGWPSNLGELAITTCERIFGEPDSVPVPEPVRVRRIA